ncbi:MAG TPA: c-type cytochrome biogenesis protein CcmI [Permianibacter sp.]|nr:c-type cytochrome biogenesis protein CcmI [Permianibacter sp.]
MSVMMFLAVSAILLLLVLFVLLRPLWLQEMADTDRLALNKTLYRERAAELEQLLASGAIDAEEKARRDAENARRLLADVEHAEARTQVPTSRLPLVLSLSIALPLLAALVYWQIGSYTQVKAWQSLDATEVGDQRNMVDMLLMLRTRLHDDPEDLEGWYLLGRSYLSMERPREALQAFDHARKLNPNEPDYLVAYAQTLRMAEQDAALPEVDRLLRQALQLDPNHEGARLLTAYRNMETGRFDEAIAVFTALKANRAADSESSAMLDKVIADARAAQARAGAAAAPAGAVSAGSVSGGSAGNAANAAAPQSAAASTESLSVAVSLAPALKGKAGEQARVFVFARAESGPGLPVAVAVLPVSALPTTVTLSDANAMNPAVKLSGQQRVTLVARVSMKGTVEPSPGDLEGKLAAFDWRQQPKQQLLIDSVL